jgi:hypothetical protein
LCRADAQRRPRTRRRYRDLVAGYDNHGRLCLRGRNIAATGGLFVVGRLTRRSKAATRNSARIGRTIFGGVLVVVGLAALTGFDRILEASLVQIMPEWLVSFATQV